MVQRLVPKSRKPEVRRVDPQYRVALPEEVRKALDLDRDDYVFFTLDGPRAILHKVKLD